MRLQKTRCAQRAQRESGAAAGFVGDFDALSGAGEQHGMVADDVSAAYRGEADGGRIALAGDAFAAIHGALRKVASQGFCDHLAHAERGAGRRVHFVAMVRFDDLDVVAVRQYQRGGLQQLEHQIHAHAHVGREHDADILRRRAELRLLLRVESGGADHHVHAEFAADVEVMQRAFGAGEIDQHVRAFQCGSRIRADLYAARRAAQLSGITPQQRAAALLQRGVQRQIVSLCDAFQQSASHASAAAGDGDFYFAHALSLLLVFYFRRHSLRKLAAIFNARQLVALEI